MLEAEFVALVKCCIIKDLRQYMMKTCNTCKQTKPRQDYPGKPTGKDKYSNTCKRCTNDRRKAFRRKNPDIVKNECLRRTFGITLDEYRQILLEQGGVCDICGKPETSTFRGKLKHLSVDHDHETGKVRGLLCNDCNIGLGWFKDNVQVLRNAIHYLNVRRVKERR